MSLDLSSNFPQFSIEMANDSKHSIYAFRDFRLDAEKLMLYHGSEEISLPPKVVRTLAVLVENRGEILSKDELMERVWSDAAVEESNLSQYLYLLRKTLGNREDGKPFIETLRRRGYRFTADVQQLEPGLQEHKYARTVKTKTASLTGTEQPAAPRYAVERRGNVFALVDRKDAEAPEFELVPGGLGAKRFPTARVIVAAAALIIVSTSLWIFSGRSSQSLSLTDQRSEITFDYLTNGEVAENATISRDGQYFVYNNQDDKIAHLWLQQIGQSSRIEIIPAGERTLGSKSFSPDGKFIYYASREKNDGQFALYKVPTLGGPTTKILDNVTEPVSFSPDGKQMVFLRFDSKSSASSLVIAPSVGGNERVLLSRNGDQAVHGGAWSPDGKLVAFGSVDLTGPSARKCTIAVVGTETGSITAVSDEKWATCYRMAWMPDGKGLVFIGTRDNEGNSTHRDQVYYISYPQGVSRRLTNEGNRHETNSLGVTTANEVLAVPFARPAQIWSMSSNGDSHTAFQISSGIGDGRAGIAPLPDGRVGYIARTGENVNVWMMNADGTNRSQLSNNPEAIEELRAAPTGDFFVFSSSSNGKDHLFRIDTDGRNLKQLTFGDNYETDSTISPDGRQLVYDASIFNGTYGTHSLWKIASDGGDPQRLSDVACGSPNFSPDGTMISCVFNDSEILILSLTDGSLIRKLKPAEHATLNFGARWTPDGHDLVYIKNSGSLSNLWIQPLDGGEPRQLTNFTSGAIYYFAFSSDGTRLYVSRGNQIHDAVIIRNFR